MIGENSEGVVMNQSNNRYNLILLGTLDLILSLFHQETLPVKLTFAFKRVVLWGHYVYLLLSCIHSTLQQEIDFH